MFEDSRRKAQGYQAEALREFLTILAPPTERPYDVYARIVRQDPAKQLIGQGRSISRTGEDSYGPDDMDVSAIVGLLADSYYQSAREGLSIPWIDYRVRQELYNMRNDRNDFEAHLGAKTELLSLGASYVMAEHLMRFLLALSKSRPDGVCEQVLTDYCDCWFARVRRFVAGLESLLLDYEREMEPERKAGMMLERVLSIRDEDKEMEYHRVWSELYREGTRADDYGHPRSEKEREEAHRCLSAFALKAADAGIVSACDSVRRAAVEGGYCFDKGDYVTRATTLLRLSRYDGLKVGEKVWLAGIYRCGLLQTHSAGEGDQLLKEAEAELPDDEWIEPCQTEEGYTFYRIRSGRSSHPK